MTEKRWGGQSFKTILKDLTYVQFDFHKKKAGGMRQKKYLKKIIAKSFLNLVEDINIQIQKIINPKEDKYTEIYTYIHHIQTPEKQTENLENSQ